MLYDFLTILLSCKCSMNLYISIFNTPHKHFPHFFFNAKIAISINGTAQFEE